MKVPTPLTTGLEWTRDGASCLHFHALGPAPLRPNVRRKRMRLSKPLYSGLPACRGRSDEEVERLTRLVYRSRPSLLIFPIIAFVLFLVSVWIPRRLSGWTGISMLWTLAITGAALGIPITIYEQRVHRPAVNTEMGRVLAEPGAAPNGGSAEPFGSSHVRGGPPSVS
ncbi:hypothetical protein SBV1_230017 [Verrucomicrobia bacterium]|nr:hypothetical protein SBV1_230017 [Verrucomicrobiota bacterium]